MEHKMTISKDSLPKAILKIYNFNLNLSELEIDIIACMISNSIEEINPDSKEFIRVTLNKDKYITNNYIKRLKDKGILIPRSDHGVYTLNPNIINLTKESKISFEFEIV